MNQQEETAQASAPVEVPEEKKWHFTLVLGEVRYSPKNKPSEKRSQVVHVFSIADIEQYPNRRLVQIQQSCFANVQQDNPNIVLDTVIIHNLIPLGQMTMTEFHSENGQVKPHTVMPVEVASGQAPSEH